MAWIVLSVLIAILFWVGIGMWIYGRKSTEIYKEKVATGVASGEPPLAGIGGIGIAILAVFLWIAMTGFFMLKTVGEREVGIVYNFTGTIAGKKTKGWVTIAPWQRMEKQNVAIQHEEFIFGKDNSAVSKDQQDIFANLAVNFQIDAENVLDLYRRVGPSWKSIIIDARVPQVFKEVTSTFQTPAITERREELREQTRERLIQELKPYDIDVVDVFITNLGFSELYSQAIEQKQKQVQDALQAEAKVKQVEAEARQRVARAEGEAKSNIALAAGDAKANRLRQRSLTPMLVQWEAIQKLNPNVSIIVCPPKSVCIPNSGVVPQP
jgi:Membrane protease subunits, stomatin/prohibitin homologs